MTRHDVPSLWGTCGGIVSAFIPFIGSGNIGRQHICGKTRKIYFATMQFPARVRLALESMGTMKFFRMACTIMEVSGLSNFPDGKSPLRNRLQYTYVFALTVYCFIFLVTHAWSTATRAIRYTPEFLQCLLEDMILWMTWVIVFTTFLHAKKFVHLIETMERSFLMDAEMSSRCAVKVRNLLMSYISCLLILVATVLLQELFPLSEEEFNIRQVVYADTARPERTLPSVIKIPGVDETVSWNYELMLCYQLSLGYVLFTTLIFTVSLLPIMTVHMEAQYMILDKHLRPLGRRDYFLDRRGEDSETATCSQNSVTRRSKVHRRMQWIEDMQSHLEFNLLRGTIRQHQRLIQFQQEMSEFYTPAMVPLSIINYTCFGLSIYQLAINPSAMSKLRFFRFLSEFVVLTFEYFLISNCSEVTDNCSGILRRSIQNCNWYNCSVGSRRILCMMLRRLQRDNRLNFFHGLVVLSRAQFLRVVRLGYTFANTMRMHASDKF